MASLLLTGQTQVAARPPGSNPAQDLADFGVSGIEVRSVKSLDTTAINSEISQAAGKGEKWPQEAVLVALKMAGAGLKGSSKIIEVQTPPESQETATITVTESGYLDDAVGGERWRLWLSKGDRRHLEYSSGAVGPVVPAPRGKVLFSREMSLI